MGFFPPWKKLFNVLVNGTVFFVLGVLYTWLKPFKYFSNKRLAAKFPALTEKAVKGLQCGAQTKRVLLPNANITLQVVEAGDPSSKMVLLLHGFPENWHSWKSVIPALVKAGYYAVAPDMPGYGLSDKPKNVSDYSVLNLQYYLEDLAAYYQKDSIFVIAHDWGGAIGWSLTANRPDLVEKLVILNAPHPGAFLREFKSGWNQLLSSWYMFFFQIPFLPANLLGWNPVKMLESLFRTKRANRASPEDLELLGSGMVQPGALDGMLNYYKALFRAVLTGKMPKTERIDAPVLVLWGESDVALTRGCADCKKWVPNVQVQYIPNCSHWVQYEVPEIVERETLNFFATN